MEAWKFVVLIIGSYLIGNIFFARIINKIRGVDTTKMGSGNPGTMNMVRTQGFYLGLLTLVLDMMKGVIPAIVGNTAFFATCLFITGLNTFEVAMILLTFSIHTPFYT